MEPSGITSSLASEGSSFGLGYSINCPVGAYVACDGVDRYFDIERALGMELIDVGSGIMITKPIVVDKGLKGWHCMYSSLSHYGVIAIHCGGNLQLTDLKDGRQIDVYLAGEAQTGFYDSSLVLLSRGCPLKACNVEDMFDMADVKVLRSVGDVAVLPYSDVSLLQSTRELVFASTSYIPHIFDVDTEETKMLGIGRKVWAFASLTGISAGIRGLFKEHEEGFALLALKEDDSTSIALEPVSNWGLCTFIPSSANPEDIRRGMKIFRNGLFFTDTTDGVMLKTPISHQFCQSIVRLYRDVFLAHDQGTGRWVIVRIVVP